jgi:hypothetical protein
VPSRSSKYTCGDNVRLYVSWQYFPDDNNDDNDDNNDNNDQLSSEQRQTRFDALPQLPLTFDPPVVQAGKLFVKVLEAKHLPVSVCHLNTVT